MNISAVRPYNNTFTSQQNDGSYIIKSNAGKFIGLGIGVGCLVENVRRKGGFPGFLKDAREGYAKVLTDAAKNSGVPNAQFSENKLGKLVRVAYARKAAITAGIVVGCLVAGAVVDKFVNIFTAKKMQAEHY